MQGILHLNKVLLPEKILPAGWYNCLPQCCKTRLMEPGLY